MAGPTSIAPRLVRSQAAVFAGRAAALLTVTEPPGDHPGPFICLSF
jgi:hypothetical protein